MLLLAFISEMMTVQFGLLWLSSGKLRVRFRAPVFLGDTVTARGTLRRVAQATQEAVYDVSCRNQSGQDVITGQAAVQWRSQETTS